MADYFTKFSFCMTLPSKEAQQYALELHKKISDVRDGDLDKDLPESLTDMDTIGDWQFETTPLDKNFGLWLHSEYGGVDAVCEFVSHLLEKFSPRSRVEFEWSHDCTSAKTDAYGGGAAIITAKKIRTMSTSQWLLKNN